MYTRVIIESPYAGDVARNVEYARRCMKDSIRRGEAPLVSHLLYTQVLDDTDTAERRDGIECGFAWREGANHTVIYTDYGISYGMQLGIDHATEIRHTMIYRQIGEN